MVHSNHKGIGPGLPLLHLVDHLVQLQLGGPVGITTLSAGSWQLPWERKCLDKKVSGTV